VSNRGGFSWKRLSGYSGAKAKLSRKTGIPFTKSGRQRKLGRMVSGGGCALPLAIVLLVLASLACGASPSVTPGAATSAPRATSTAPKSQPIATAASTKMPDPTATSAPTFTPEQTVTAIPPSATPVPPTATEAPPQATLAPTKIPQRAAPTVAIAPVVAAGDQGYTCDKCIKGNINSKGDKLYHHPGCPSYKVTKIDPGQGERMFSSEAEARAAGWSKANNCP
jgi:hypothetical protein